MRMRSVWVAPSLVFSMFVALGCGSDDGAQPSDGLRSAFPQHAERVLTSKHVWQRLAHGYQLDGQTNHWQQRQLSAQLAERAEDGFVLDAGGELQLRVVELDAGGVVEPAGQAISYARPDGRSFWVAQNGGLEEWLFVEHGVKDASQPVASWQVEGGYLAQYGDSVTVAPVAGAPVRVMVSAPWAYGPKGPLAVRLALHGQRIDVHVEVSEGPLLIDPIWLDVAMMNAARAWHAAARLGNGQVVALGGESQVGIIGAAETYDPINKVWTPQLPQPVRARHTATSLNDGTVLFVGGKNASFELDLTQTYAAAGGFVNRPGLTDGRFNHTATLLNNGNVMVCGGQAKIKIAVSTSNGFDVLDSCEIYDAGAATPSWGLAPAMNKRRQGHAAVTLASGDVIQCAGCDDQGIFLSSCEIWSPAAPNWAQLPKLPAPRAHHTLTALNDGRVLLTGGDNFGTASNLAWLLDPANPTTWIPTGTTMNQARTGHTATLLNDGRVLIVGGTDAAGNATNTAELFYPGGNGAFAPTATMALARGYQQATALSTGSVLVSGGRDSVANTFLGQSEVYQLLLPNGTACNGGGAGASCVSGNCVDGVCCDSVCTGTCMACSSKAKGGGTEGVCEPVQHGVGYMTECPDNGWQSCGYDGFCDGTGSCALYDSKTICSYPVCQGDEIASSSCNGAGACVSDVPQGCAPYTCLDGDGAYCAPSCKTDAECAQNAYCAADFSCQPKKTNGAPAVNTKECASGFVADGVCCDTACDMGPCDACTVALNATADGVCTAVSGNCDDGNPCTDDSCSPEGCSSESRLDGSLCPGGQCYGAKCIPDNSAGGSGAGTGGAGGSASSGGDGGSAASSGAGGDAIEFNFDDGIPALEGGGFCTAARAGARRRRGPYSGWMLAGLALALGALRRRRVEGEDH